MNRLWRNDRSALAEPASREPRKRPPAGSLCAAEDHEDHYLSPEEIHAGPLSMRRSRPFCRTPDFGGKG